jgi:peptide deformylase
MGDPVLWQRAEPVADPADPAIQALAADMIETMHAAGGVGLAAPQVGVSARLFVFRVPPSRLTGAADDTEAGDCVLINPEIELLGDTQVLGWEGCLSIPGLRAVVPRAHRLVYRGVALNGERIEREAAGFHARVIQHEFDHLNGVLYPMRMTDFSQFGFNEELAARFSQA